MLLFRIAEIHGRSMEPTYRNGDKVLVWRYFRRVPISVGDIVVFRSDILDKGGPKYVIHRIVAIKKTGEIFTKGDRNGKVDRGCIRTKDIVYFRKGERK